MRVRSISSGSAFRRDDADINPTADHRGGFAIGGTAEGEWLAYEFRVTIESSCANLSYIDFAQIE
jgi:hypothetical protein